MAVIAALDAVTGSEVSFSLFYLAPVVFAGGLISHRAGLAMAVVSAAAWGYLDRAMGATYSANWIPVWNSLVRLGFFVVVNELVYAVGLAHARQAELARKDSLTGANNTRVFNERVELTIAQSLRDGRPFTLVYLDLDRFKSINDEFGHSEGDRLLCDVSDAVDSSLRATDVMARLGGDEFGILMPQTGGDEARAWLDRLTAELSRDAGKRWGIGATLGAMTFTRPPDNVDAAVRAADELMYRGKAQGRGVIVQGVSPAPDLV